MKLRRFVSRRELNSANSLKQRSRSTAVLQGASPDEAASTRSPILTGRELVRGFSRAAFFNCTPGNFFVSRRQGTRDGDSLSPDGGGSTSGKPGQHFSGGLSFSPPSAGSGRVQYRGQTAGSSSGFCNRKGSPFHDRRSIVLRFSGGSEESPAIGDDHPGSRSGQDKCIEEK